MGEKHGDLTSNHEDYIGYNLMGFIHEKLFKQPH